MQEDKLGLLSFSRFAERIQFGVFALPRPREIQNPSHAYLEQWKKFRFLLALLGPGLLRNTLGGRLQAEAPSLHKVERELQDPSLVLPFVSSGNAALMRCLHCNRETGHGGGKRT